jgi:hypothetical protein
VDSWSINAPTLSIDASASVVDQMVVVGGVVTIGSQAVTSTVSDVVSLATPVSHFLVGVSLPWADDCVLHESVIVALSVGNSIVSHLFRSDTLSSVVKYKPLLHVPWLHVFDSQKVVVASNVFRISH